MIPMPNLALSGGTSSSATGDVTNANSLASGGGNRGGGGFNVNFASGGSQIDPHSASASLPWVSWAIVGAVGLVVVWFVLRRKS